MPVTAVAGAAALAVAAATSLSPAVVRKPDRSVDPRDQITRVRTTHKVIALTLDDGPNAGATQQVLSLLQSNQAKATFFLIGQRVERDPELVRAEQAAGHEIATHTWSHKDLTRLPERARADEIEKGIAAVQRVTGTTPALFRAPYGASTTVIGGQVAAAGAKTVGWTADMNVEGVLQHETVAQTVRTLRRRARKGAIILAHDGPYGRPRTLAVLKKLVPALRADGYRFVTVSDLLSRAGR